MNNQDLDQKISNLEYLNFVATYKKNVDFMGFLESEKKEVLKYLNNATVSNNLHLYYAYLCKFEYTAKAQLLGFVGDYV